MLSEHFIFSVQKYFQFSHLYFTALQQGILNISLALPTPPIPLPSNMIRRSNWMHYFHLLGWELVCGRHWEEKERWNERNKKIRCIGIFHFSGLCVYGSAAINNPTLEAMWTNPYLPLLTIWTLLILESNSFQTDRQTNGHKVSISQTILSGPKS